MRCHEIPMPPVRTFGAMTTIVKQKARNLSRWSLFMAIMNHFNHHRFTKQRNSVTMVPSHYKTRHLGRFMIENRPRCRSVIICIRRYGRVTSSIGSYFSGTEPDGVHPAYVRNVKYAEPADARFAWAERGIAIIQTISSPET